MDIADVALGDLLQSAHLAAQHHLPALITRCATAMGAQSIVIYLVDLQQQVLVPFVEPEDAGDTSLAPLSVDATLAGRAFQNVEVHVQEIGAESIRLLLPLLDGSERLGVLAVTISPPELLTAEGSPLEERLRRLASLASELLVTKTSYGDTLVRLRRREPMTLAAEMQWSLLPPLTFACEAVTIAAALEPAYSVAGDTIDYSVDAGITRLAIFDGMGHGLQSGQLAALAVGAYRHSRRAGRSLTDTVIDIDAALESGFGGDVFATALIAELDTDTGLLRWVNAGHPAPLLLRAGRWVKSLEVEPVPPLGLGYLGDTADLTVGSEQLEPADRVLLYTDGVIEARSPEGDFFGLNRLVDLVGRHLLSGLPPPETTRRVAHALLAHQQAQLTDDATLMLLEWHSGTGQRMLP